MRSHKGDILDFLTSVLFYREGTPVLVCIPLCNHAHPMLHAPGMTVIDPSLMIRYWEGLDIHPEGLVPRLKSILAGGWSGISGLQGICGEIFISFLRKLYGRLLRNAESFVP